MRKYLKRNIIALILIAVFLAIGTFFIIFAPGRFFLIFSYLLAAYLLAVAAVLTVISFRKKRHAHILFSKTAVILELIILMALVVLTIVFPAVLLLIDVILVMIVSPTVAVVAGCERRKLLIRNLWKYITGAAFIIIILWAALHDPFLIAAGFVFYAAAGFLIYLLIINSGPGEKPCLFDKYLVKYIVLLCGKKE